MLRLTSATASPPGLWLQGQQLNPHLRRLVQSGMLSVRVERAEGLDASSLFGRPSM